MRDIAAQMKVSVGGVYKTLRAYEECGEYTNPSRRRTGRPQILDDDDDTWYLKLLLESNPTLYLDEMKHKLGMVRNVSVSMATMSRFLGISNMAMNLFRLFSFLRLILALFVPKDWTFS